MTDGDTFRLESGERIRIAGIDAPETQPGNAKCRAEIARGKAATAKAVALLKGREVRFERVGRSYNRTVARVWLGGRDLAGTLVETGAARWWPRGKSKRTGAGIRSAASREFVHIQSASEPALPGHRLRSVICNQDAAQHFVMHSPWPRQLREVPRAIVSLEYAELCGAAQALLIQ